MASPSAAASLSGSFDLATANTVNGLRKVAASDPVRAQEAVWALFKQVGDTRDEAALESIFSMGRAPLGLHGPSDGLLLATFAPGVLNALARLVTRPWLGMEFDRGTMTGRNRLSPSPLARALLKLVFPLKSLGRASDGGTTAFEFENAREPGRQQPAVEVLKIDYAPVKSCPWLVLSRLREELVEITPATYLGRMLWHRGEGRYALLGYFALRQPAGKQ